MRASRLLLASAALLGLLGCSESIMTDPKGSTCVSDVECADLEACVLGICVDPRNQRLDEVDLEIRPPEGSGQRPQQVFGVRVGPESTESRSVVKLRETVAVRGDVVDAAGAGVAAQVVAVPLAGIPGRALVASTAASGPQGAFALPLVEADPDRPDDRYRLTIYPDESHARPPHYLDDNLRVEARPPGELDLGAVALPEVASLRTVSGRVITSDGTVELPVSGLEVRLFDDTKRLSSVGLTDTDGSFTVHLPPEAPQLLTVEVRPTEQSRLSPLVRKIGLDLGSELVIDLGPLEAPVPFSGVVRGPEGEPVPGARIYARQERDDAVMSVLTVAGEDGSYDGELRPGRYAFAVLPPSSEPDAGLLVGFEASVGAEASPAFNLPERIDVAGAVTDDDGNPVPGAEVTLTRIASWTGAPERVLEGVSWSFTALTDGSGGFSLRVDQGRYRVRVVPDPGSGLPRQTRILDVAEPTADVKLALPPKALIAGELQAHDGAPLDMAQVTAFSTIIGETGEPFELGAALTSGDGRFEIVLPDLDAE